MQKLQQFNVYLTNGSFYKFNCDLKAFLNAIDTVNLICRKDIEGTVVYINGSQILSIEVELCLD